LSLILALLCGCSSKTKIPKDWKPSDTKCFTFLMPPDMKGKHREQLDGDAGDYRNKSIALSFEYSWYTDPIDGRPSGLDFQEGELLIDKKTARLVTLTEPASVFPYRAAVYFRETGTGKNTGGSIVVSPNLTMKAESTTPEAQETVKKIFGTIRFPKEQRGECLGD